MMGSSCHVADGAREGITAGDHVLALGAYLALGVVDQINEHI